MRPLGRRYHGNTKIHFIADWSLVYIGGLPNPKASSSLDMERETDSWFNKLLLMAFNRMMDEN